MKERIRKRISQKIWRSVYNRVMNKPDRRYLCYALQDGSFSFGRIKAEGTVNTPEGIKDVFIISGRTTCRVPKNPLEMASFKAISRRIEAGTDGPRLNPHETPEEYMAQLPAYQQDIPEHGMALPASQEQHLLPESTDEAPEPDLEEPSNLPAIVETGMTTIDGETVPALATDGPTGKGLRMLQKTVSIESSADSGRILNFILRRYGYDTNVRKDELDIEGGDVVDRKMLNLPESCTDDELLAVSINRRMLAIGATALGLGDKVGGKKSLELSQKNAPS